MPARLNVVKKDVLKIQSEVIYLSHTDSIVAPFSTTECIWLQEFLA